MVRLFFVSIAWGIYEDPESFANDLDPPALPEATAASGMMGIRDKDTNHLRPRVDGSCMG